MNMEFEMQPYGVYVKTDEKQRIIAINSDAFLPDTDGWVKIDEGFGDRFHHAQGNYLDKPIRDERGICRYKLEDGKPVERTQEEMDADYNPPAPAPESTDRARITALEQKLAAYEAAYREGVEDV
jgi:hypothetical protein